ncbi:MAG: SatD family protein [Bacteroidota bacterium]
MEKVYAVITGDIVASTAIERDYKQILHAIVEDIRREQEKGFVFEIFRGDSFQALVSDPTKAVLIAILIRAGLRRYARGNNLDDAWDARVALGIGTVSNLDISDQTKLGTSDGEAFLRSGRTLDGMKSERALLKITTGDEQLDSEFSSICPLVDVIISKWSTVQAEVVYLNLLKSEPTQTKIGEMLGKSQKAVSKSIDTSNIESMKPFFERYQQLIQWKYNS